MRCKKTPAKRVFIGTLAGIASCQNHSQTSRVLTIAINDTMMTRMAAFTV